jgi:hypothetical protein
MAARITIDAGPERARACSFLRGHRGGASIEFVWSTIVLVFVMMFVFRIFQATIRGSGGLVNARHAAFSALGSSSTAPGMQGREGLVYTSDVLSGGASVGSVNACTGDCGNKLFFQYVGPEEQYPYGLSGFEYQVRQGVAVYLQ